MAAFRKEGPIERQPINKLPDFVLVKFCLPDAKGVCPIGKDIIEVKVKFHGNPYREFLFLLHSSMIFLDSPTVWKGPFSAS